MHAAMDETISLDIGTLHAAYTAGTASVADVIDLVSRRVAASAASNAWIAVHPPAVLAQRVRAIGAMERSGLPLFGIPFAVKDNIDVAGLDTTAACPGYAYRPARSATAVERLEAAGAVCIGKTNLDQFATGLSGVRSPYGACSSVFDAAYISGGSSSGSAIAVAAGLASIALGTDTGGSGRIPAGWNNIVGLKPTRGLVGAGGLVPNCRTLDCVSVFALNVAGPDARDPFSRSDAAAERVVPRPAPATFRFAVPPLSVLDDEGSRLLFQQAIDRMTGLGGTAVVIDFAPFAEASELMFGGPWVAERLAALRGFVERTPNALLPVTRDIILGASRWSAADTFDGLYRLQALKQAMAHLWSSVEILMVPTALRPFTHAELEREPVAANNAIGRFSYFVNLLDLAALAVPNGLHPCGVASGITLVAPPMGDGVLSGIGAAFHAALGLPPGAPVCGMDAAR
jgi:allophanate hydrolase